MFLEQQPRRIQLQNGLSSTGLDAIKLEFFTNMENSKGTHNSVELHRHLSWFDLDHMAVHNLRMATRMLPGAQ